MRNLIVVVAALALCVVAPRWGVAQEEGSESKTEEKPQRSMMEAAQNRTSDEDYTDLLGRPGNGPAVGVMAPDFELMPLKFYEFELSDADITEENAGELYRPVKLSAFRGEKPVVLIFGSYT